MICATCKYAGQRNADGHYHIAKGLHLQCEHPQTCPCHHVVGERVLVDQNRAPKEITKVVDGSLGWTQ